MPNKSLIFKLFVSAVVGFLIGAGVVLFPGTLFMRPSMRKGPNQQILEIYHHGLCDGIYLKQEEQIRSLDELMDKAFWLCLAQNELDCLPFLVFTTIMGPAIVLNRTRRGTTSSG